MHIDTTTFILIFCIGLCDISLTLYISYLVTVRMLCGRECTISLKQLTVLPAISSSLAGTHTGTHKQPWVPTRVEGKR